MKHHPAGKSGISLPPIIFGTSALGNLFSVLSDETKTSIVSECLRLVPKPVVFDSAGKYGAGLALEKLGEILGKLGTKPEDVIISNKLGWLRKPLTTPEPTFEKGVWAGIEHDAWQNISYDGIIECWEQGNELLGGYMPQLVSVHDPDEYLASAKNPTEHNIRLGNIAAAYRSLAGLKSAGKVKAVGVGAKKWETIRLIAEMVDLDWVMIANSMTIYRHPKELLRFMEQLNSSGVAIINSAVFHAGFLTGGAFFDYVKLDPGSPENIQKFKWRETFFAICRKHDVRPADACVQFAMTPPGVISISLNTSNPARVGDNVASVQKNIHSSFWLDMKDSGLIAHDYPYL
jgi:D-threo-aldose 1-dehydrogenase